MHCITSHFNMKDKFETHSEYIVITQHFYVLIIREHKNIEKA